MKTFQHVHPICKLFAVGALALAGVTAQAQSTISNLIVPYPAGGPSDFAARTLLPELSRLTAQTIVVDNVGGVGGALGIQKALQAPANGQTMVLATPMELMLTPLAVQAARHKPEDMRPVAILVGTSMVMLTRKDLPANSVDELVEMTRKPGAKELTFGSVGAGSMYHLVAEAFMQQTSVKMVHVPYKGGAPLVGDLMGGQIDVAFMPMAGNVPALIKDGKVKALGVAARQPHPMAPQVPTLTSTKALEKFEFDLWAGLFVSRQTPDAVVDKLNQAVNQALLNPEVRKAYESTGNQVAKPQTPAALNLLYASETARYQALAKSINVQPQ
jgi:tripartite-type tricarboxylate transporter receptor subunit TctC